MSRNHAHFLRHLVVFEVACRSENFSRTGEELGMSRVAVSRQIAELEAYLDTRLFVRGHRSVHPTQAGADLASIVEPALSSIATALERLQDPAEGSRLRVTTTVAFGTLWLMPRLADFSARHPQIEIDLVVSDRYLDLDSNDLDIAIRYGPDAPDGAEALTRETIVPVWSPAYTPHSPLVTPNDLLSERLLQLGGHYRAEARWEHWFATQGLEFPGAALSTQFNSYVTMFHAVFEGQGIALAGTPLIDAPLADGRLVKLASTPALPRDFYWLVCRPGHPSAEIFAAWIRSHFQAP